MSKETILHDAISTLLHGRMQDTERLYHQVLSHEPYRADALINLATLLDQNGRRHEAIRLYEEGIRRAPCLEFYVNLGIYGFPKGGLISPRPRCKRRSSLTRTASPRTSIWRAHIRCWETMPRP